MSKEKVKILIVEDDKDLRESIKEILELEGYKISESTNVKDALENINIVRPHLIISDILMPGESGLDLLRKVKSIPDFFNVPFVFLTAQSDSQQVRAGMNLGADDYLTKPFKKDDLINSLKLRLEKKFFIDNKLDMFYDGISKYIPHELRTPLVAMLGYPEFVKENFENLSKLEICEIMDHISFAGKRMQDTLEKFIMYTDVCSSNLVNNFELNSKISDIQKIIKSTINEIEDKNFRKGTIKINTSEAVLKIEKSHLKIILKQLIENSLKFSEEGSNILVSGKIEGEKYLFEICDEGIGMTKEFISKIGAFIQFKREENQQSGNGLGLVIVKNILKQYGYNLNIESVLGEGTKVSFVIDIAYNNNC